jgi:hypothetical protein
MEDKNRDQQGGVHSANFGGQNEHKTKGPVAGAFIYAGICVVELVGIEPTTSPLRTARSPKLSYSPTWSIVASVSATLEFRNKPRSFFGAEKVIDQIITQLEIEITGVLRGILRIRVEDHNVGAL